MATFEAHPKTTPCAVRRTTILIKGLAGNDSLFGNRGDDKLFGGPGFDKFFFGPGFGRDDIFDFNTDRTK